MKSSYRISASSIQCRQVWKRGESRGLQGAVRGHCGAMWAAAPLVVLAAASPLQPRPDGLPWMWLIGEGRLSGGAWKGMTKS